MRRAPRFGTAIALVVVAAAACSSHSSNESSPTTSAPARSRQPNIVFVLTDDQTTASVGVMPYLSSKPAGPWVDFTKAFIENPACCPSRATILSGQYSSHTGVDSNTMGDRFDETTSLAIPLRRSGYTTGLIGKYLNDFPFQKGPYIPKGWDTWITVRGTAFFDYQLLIGTRKVKFGHDPQDYKTDVLGRRAAAFIRTAPAPFFLYFAPTAPHQEEGAPPEPAPRDAKALNDLAPFRPPSYDEADVSDKPAWVQKLPRITAQVSANLDDLRTKEDRSLLAVDDALRSIDEALRFRGALDDTIVIFMTDNGFALGEHRFATKFCGYEPCIRTPLLVRDPFGVAHSDAHLVGNVDMAPTILDLAGVAPSHGVDGRSIVPLLDGESPKWRDALLLHGHGTTVVTPFDGLRTDRWKYLELTTGERELYDLQADPDELVNLASDPTKQGLIAQLHDQLSAMNS